MAGEIQTAYNVRGAAVYAEVRNDVGEPYSTTTGLFAAYSAGSFGNYAVSLTEQGSSGIYAGDMPLVVAGVYSIVARVRAGGSPAQSDAIIGSGTLDWTGAAVLSPPATSERIFLALPNSGYSAVGGLLTVGGSDGQIYPSGGKVRAIVAGADVSGFPEVNAVKLAGQTVTAASGVAFPAAVGNSTLTTSQVKAEADQSLADVGLTTTITGRVDAAVSSRLAAGNYTAPLDAAGVRAAVGLAAANLDTRLDAADAQAADAFAEFATVYSRFDSLDSQLAAVPTAEGTAAAVRSELSTELAHLDADVGSRASQTSLDAAHDIAEAIQAVTDKLDTTVELDGPAYRFTANALEEAPVTAAAPTAAAIRAELDANSTRLAAIAADAAELLGDWTDGGRLDLILDGRASQASVGAVEGIAEAIQTRTDNLPASPAATGDIPSAADVAGQVRTELTTELGRLDAAVSSRLASGNVTVGGFAAGLLPAHFAALTIDSDGRVLLQTTQPGVTIPTVTDVTNAVSVSGNLTIPELAYLDAPVSSRLAAADYAAPDNAAVGNIASSVAALHDLSAADVRGEVDAALGNAGVSTGVMGRLDVAVSTRGTLAAGAAMTLADGAITEDTIALPEESPGLPAGVLGMVRRLWEKATHRRTRDRSTGLVTLYGADGETALEVSTQSTAGTTDTFSAGAGP